MDCILNLQIPKSTDSVFIIRPSGKTFITGVASSYSHKYNPKILKNYIYEEEFISMIQTLNETLFSYWPCPLCFCIGYILCPCSFGFSFMMPQQCIGDAEEALRNWVEYQNQYKFKQRGIKLKYKRQCSTSWIELHLKPEEDEDEEENQNQLQLTEQSHQHQQENITAKKHKKKGNNQDKIHDHNKAQLTYAESMQIDLLKYNDIQNEYHYKSQQYHYCQIIRQVQLQSLLNYIRQINNFKLFMFSLSSISYLQGLLIKMGIINLT